MNLLALEDHETPALPDGISWYAISVMIDRQSDIRPVRTVLKRSRVHVGFAQLIIHGMPN